jgi:hypothetical protein
VEEARSRLAGEARPRDLSAFAAHNNSNYCYAWEDRAFADCENVAKPTNEKNTDDPKAAFDSESEYKQA